MNLSDARRLPAKGSAMAFPKRSTAPARKAPPMPPVPKGMKPLLAQDARLDKKLGKYDNDADERRLLRGKKR